MVVIVAGSIAAKVTLSDVVLVGRKLGQNAMVYNVVDHLVRAMSIGLVDIVAFVELMIHFAIVPRS